MNSSPQNPTAHDSTWELIPWYLNGTLDEDEAAAVRQHLAICVACREEAREQEIVREHVAEAGSRPERAPAAFAALSARLDAEAAPARRTVWPAALRMAALLAVAVGIFTLAGLRDSETAGHPTEVAVHEALADGATLNEFDTLSTPGTCEGDVNVYFVDGAGAASIDALLESRSLSLACPPGPNGLYKLRIDDGSDPEAIAGQLKSEEIVDLALAKRRP